MKTMNLVTLLGATLLITAGCGTNPQIKLTQGQDRVDVTIDGHGVTSYLYSSELAKPVLFPIRTLSGTAVTRQYPFGELAGESRDHPHHTGFYFTYGDVNGTDFWGNTKTPPQVKHIKITQIDSGQDQATLSTVMHWIDKDHKVLLEEKRDMIFSRETTPNAYAIDVNITLTAQDTPVVFNDTKEGAFAIRVADWLTEKSGTGRYLSSNGEETAENVWGKRASWMRLQGEKKGKPIGIAILNHPDSVNYPTYWMARDYGLFSANPLGQLVYQKHHKVENPQPFNLTLAPGESTRFQHRIIIYQANLTKEQLDQEFQRYTKK
jgi:hypothetical protein